MRHPSSPFKHSLTCRIISASLAFVFSFGVIFPPYIAEAQVLPMLPLPGAMVSPTPGYVPALIKGITIHPENPLEFDFIIDPGDSGIAGEQLETESVRLIKYFLASLTVPEEEMWVNLSPYEGDRIVPKSFGATGMGMDLLAQDYILKQLTASLMYPEEELGETFWKRVYEKAKEEYGTTDIPVDSFHKVWIVPEEAVVYQKDNSAFVIRSHLKVMMEQDYLAMQKNQSQGHKVTESQEENKLTELQTEVMREVILPAIEKEVNEGENFANLRQIYQGMILATWFKKTLKESLLGQVYVNKNKLRGVETEDKNAKEKIYDQYLKAFEKGVYNYIKEDYDPATNEIVPRQYFSGGGQFGALPAVQEAVFPDTPGARAFHKDIAMLSRESDPDALDVNVRLWEIGKGGDPVKFVAATQREAIIAQSKKAAAQTPGEEQSDTAVAETGTDGPVIPGPGSVGTDTAMMTIDKQLDFLSKLMPISPEVKEEGKSWGFQNSVGWSYTLTAERQEGSPSQVKCEIWGGLWSRHPLVAADVFVEKGKPLEYGQLLQLMYDGISLKKARSVKSTDLAMMALDSGETVTVLQIAKEALSASMALRQRQVDKINKIKRGDDDYSSEKMASRRRDRFRKEAEESRDEWAGLIAQRAGVVQALGGEISDAVQSVIEGISSPERVKAEAVEFTMRKTGSTQVENVYVWVDGERRQAGRRPQEYVWTLEGHEKIAEAYPNLSPEEFARLSAAEAGFDVANVEVRQVDRAMLVELKDGSITLEGDQVVITRGDDRTEIPVGLAEEWVGGLFRQANAMTYTQMHFSLTVLNENKKSASGLLKVLDNQTDLKAEHVSIEPLGLSQTSSAVSLQVTQDKSQSKLQRAQEFLGELNDALEVKDLAMLSDTLVVEEADSFDGGDSWIWKFKNGSELILKRKEKGKRTVTRAQYRTQADREPVLNIEFEGDLLKDKGKNNGQDNWQAVLNRMERLVSKDDELLTRLVAARIMETDSLRGQIDAGSLQDTLLKKIQSWRSKFMKPYLTIEVLLDIFSHPEHRRVLRLMDWLDELSANPFLTILITPERLRDVLKYKDSYVQDVFSVAEAIVEEKFFQKTTPLGGRYAFYLTSFLLKREPVIRVFGESIDRSAGENSKFMKFWRKVNYVDRDRRKANGKKYWSRVVEDFFGEAAADRRSQFAAGKTRDGDRAMLAEISDIIAPLAILGALGLVEEYSPGLNIDSKIESNDVDRKLKESKGIVLIKKRGIIASLVNIPIAYFDSEADFLLFMARALEGNDYKETTNWFLELEKAISEKDSAMVTSTEQRATSPEYGGIDLNPELLDLKIKRDGNGIPLPMIQQPMELLNEIEGFLPVIINITPVQNLPMLLGLDTTGDDGDDAMQLSAQVGIGPYDLKGIRMTECGEQMVERG